MLNLAGAGLSARKFGRNDWSPAVPRGFRRDFEGSTCDPVPKRGVRSGFGGGDVLPGRRARREARVEQREQAFAAPPSPVPSERPFDKPPVQVLAPESVQDAEAPALEVREHAMDPLEDFMHGRVSDRDRRVVLQPVAADPAVGRDPRSRSGGVLEERLQRRAGLVHDPAELGAAGTVLSEHLDRPGDHQRPSWPRPPGGGSEPLRR